MSKRYKFSKSAIMKAYSHLPSKVSDRKWKKLIECSTELGYEVKSIKGNFLTHEINTTQDEFNIILELFKEG